MPRSVRHQLDAELNASKAPEAALSFVLVAVVCTVATKTLTSRVKRFTLEFIK